jgi:hypothetical protein
MEDTLNKDIKDISIIDTGTAIVVVIRKITEDKNEGI